MCPSGLALHHPAAPKLLQYATRGCPAYTGANWTIQQMRTMLERGPHPSAHTKAAVDYFQAEIADKVRRGKAKIVEFLDIQNDPPANLKISPLAAMEHKSRKFRGLLDLS